MKGKNTAKILTILLIMQWAMIQILAQYPEFIEKYYSNGLYTYISKVLRFFTGWIPFSIGDLFYGFLIIFSIRSIYKVLKRRKINIKNTIFSIGAIASVLYFLFYINWGLNYLRQPIAKTMDIENKTYSVDQLMELTYKIVQKSNSVHNTLVASDTLMIENPKEKNEIRKSAKFAYENLGKSYPFLSVTPLATKHSLFSLPLTYMGFAGYLNPISNEAHVNALIPKSNYPATVCHEIAHQTGIASESEANFVGFLAAMHSEDPYYQYSGYTMALRYCLFELYNYDEALYEEIKLQINKGILKDMQRSQDFWRSYQNRSEKYFKLFYDSYLKANKQRDGIRSYNKMVALLINYDLKNTIN